MYRELELVNFFYFLVLIPHEVALRERKGGEVQNLANAMVGRRTVIIPRIISVQPREGRKRSAHSLTRIQTEKGGCGGGGGTQIGKRCFLKGGIQLAQDLY